MSIENAFIVYKEYLISTAKMEGRPFSIPRDTKTFEERPDAKLFFKLWHELDEKGFGTSKGVKQFFEYARMCLKEAQHISSIIDNTDEIISFGKENRVVESRQDLIHRIQKSFSHLDEYCLLNKKSYNDLFLGTPSIILKEWKAGRIDNITGHYLVDVQKLKKESWFKIFGKGIISTYTNTKALISCNNLDTLLEAENDALKKKLKK